MNVRTVGIGDVNLVAPSFHEGMLPARKWPLVAKGPKLAKDFG